VVELARFIAASAAVDAAPTLDATRADSYLIALNAALEVNCALLVDRLEGLRSVDSFASAALALPGDPAYFGNVYTDASGESWQEINLQSLSQQPNFLSISA
jgi:twitching motility protein PilI